ncbi:unnamed protein product [Gongylonema pulchrum]|uniref:DUF3060 domain-containing protein n=1 Tax=Gongylonema pulchrum TaxID=637853 RepID=A0A183EFM5_9BILA|nr:unnamed protein product [Gongylonema pulchrum]
MTSCRCTILVTLISMARSSISFHRTRSMSQAEVTSFYTIILIMFWYVLRSSRRFLTRAGRISATEAGEDPNEHKQVVGVSTKKDWRVAGDSAELKFGHRKGEIGDIRTCVTLHRDALNLSKDVAAETHVSFADDRAQYTADSRERVDCTVTKSSCVANVTNGLGGDMQSVGVSVAKA